jgi:hypothetical protein
MAGRGRFESLSQDSGDRKDEEDTVMRDREHAEKRKRDGRQGGAEDSPQRRDARIDVDSDSTSVEATPRKKVLPIATRMITRGLEREGASRAEGGDSHMSQGSPTPAPNRQAQAARPQATSNDDIIAILLRMQQREEEERTRAQVKENEERTKAEAERIRAEAKENEYKAEIRQLQSTVTALVLDLKSLQESVPNWGSLVSSSQQTGTEESYASVAAQGVSLTTAPTQVVEIAHTPRRNSGSRVSFDLSERGSLSPTGSPAISVGPSIRSAMKKTFHKRESNMVIDLKNLDMEGYPDHEALSRTRSRIIAGIRSNEGLDTVQLNHFMIRHTNKDVHLASLKLDIEAEKKARLHAEEWINMFLKGAKLLEPTWYPVKIDLVPKMEATDQETGGVNDFASKAFSEENSVEVRQIRWLGRPKAHAAYASTVAKLATKEQVSKLLQDQEEGREITMFGCTVQVSVFQEQRGPRSCHQCQRYGHIRKDCTAAPRCSWCAQEGHESCQTGPAKCTNCKGGHPSYSKVCPEYTKRQERMINLRPYD